MHACVWVNRLVSECVSQWQMPEDTPVRGGQTRAKGQWLNLRFWSFFRVITSLVLIIFSRILMMAFRTWFCERISFLCWFHFPRHHCQCHASFSAILIGLPDCVTFSKDLGTSLRLCADDGRLQLFNLFHQIVWLAVPVHLALRIGKVYAYHIHARVYMQCIRVC